MTHPDEKRSAQDLIEWLGISAQANWHRSRLLGGFIGIALVLMFGIAFVTAFAVLFHTLGLVSSTDGPGPNLGAGALIAALLGAPFVIWGTVLKHRTVTFQKEGHITDRINKAVEMLGTEKTVERIGRPVTIWTGTPERVNYAAEDADRLVGRPRTHIAPREWERSWNHETEDFDEGYRQTVSVWPNERTVIQWQGDPLLIAANEQLGAEGSWQVFKETVPNIEVRIGAILSLERIAQDSTAYDKGRDHVRVMEILCAYVRENARVASLEPTPAPFETVIPRIDIQWAVYVMGRRSIDQIAIETASRYRLDLRSCNLDGVDFSRGRFAGAKFWNTRLEAANFSEADLTGSQFFSALLDYSIFWKTTLVGTRFDRAILGRMHFGGFATATLLGVSIEGANASGLNFGTKADDLFGSSDTIVQFSYQEDKDIGLRAADDNFLNKSLETGDRPLNSTGNLTDHQKRFLHWNPYTHSDLAAGEFRTAYRTRKGLIGWPFDD